MFTIATSYALDFFKAIFFSAKDTYGVWIINETDNVVVVTITDSKGRPTRFHLAPNESKNTKTYDASAVTISAFRERGGEPDEALITLYEGKKKQKNARIIRKGDSIELVQDFDTDKQKKIEEQKAKEEENKDSDKNE